jgi:hypothetical protein
MRKKSISHGNSTYEIQLRSEDRLEYVSISQKIKNHLDIIEIKVRKEFLQNFVKMLLDFDIELSAQVQSNSKKTRIKPTDETELIRKYFLGISPEDLSLQYDISANHVIEIIESNGLEIIDQSIPKRLIVSRKELKKIEDLSKQKDDKSKKNNPTRFGNTKKMPPTSKHELAKKFNVSIDVVEKYFGN